MEIAERHKIYVIEDCAQAIGAKYSDQKVGSFGKAGCFSLHPLKTLNAVGDGGVITTDDEELARTLLKARNHGLRNRDECDFWSYNCRLDTIQAAMLLVKMDYLDGWIEGRRKNAAFYQACLSNVIQAPKDQSHEYSVYHTFVIQAERRNELQSHLRNCGVDTKIHYPVPIHFQEGARSLGYGPGSFPETERQAKQILSLPVYPELTEAQKQIVVDSVLSFYN
jgi:dTDP-4-amino-4,6-dideoxygalactose transaminase